jgi:hypothetical protein
MSFDVVECISLHNLIDERACAQLPANLQPTVTRNWFRAHSLDASAPDLGFNLTDSLTEFLSGIDVVIPQGLHHMAFTPFLVGVSSPSEILPEIWEDIFESRQFILLYRNAEYDAGGLVMHLDTHGVTLLDTAEDDPFEAEYVEFEGTLRRYLRYIDAGKFAVDTSYERSGYEDELACQGWRYEGWLGPEMEYTLDVWNLLIDRIAERMPETPATETDEILIPTSVLDLCPSIPLFARAFLSRAKKPPFKVIAPELQVPDVDFVHRVGFQLGQKYKSATDPLELRCPSANFLLFPWETAGVPFASIDDSRCYHASPFSRRTKQPGPPKRRRESRLVRSRRTLSIWPLRSVNYENSVAGGEAKWRLADTEEHAENFWVELLCMPPEGGDEGDEEREESESIDEDV